MGKIEEEGVDAPHTQKMTQKMKMDISLTTNQRLLAIIAIEELPKKDKEKVNLMEEIVETSLKVRFH